MSGPVTYAEFGLGLHQAVVAAGHWLAEIGGVWTADNPIAVQAIINGYAGSAAQLTFAKADKQALLDDQFDQHFDLAKFIRGGTATTVTAAQVGTFLATITNNYRTLRASITAASTVAAVAAVNIASGWPSNP